MKLIKYIILILLLWGIDSFVLSVYGETFGSYASLATYLGLLVYYFLSKKRKLLFPIIILGLSYFVISGLVYVEDSEVFINEFIKYIIIVVCGAEVARNTSQKELCYFLLVGVLSILVHAVAFADGYGRYSGFYLNPNGAAFVSLIGYCLTFSIRDKKVQYFLIFIFTFTGALTFSRFFFLMWLLITLASIAGDKKNLQVLAIGFGALFLLISVAAILQVNTERFGLLQSFFDNDIQTNVMTKNARISSWAQYYDDIMSNPIAGNGYKSFSGQASIQGVHNTYLMVIGEAGIIPFIIIIGIYINLIKRSFSEYKNQVYKLLLALSLSAILLTMHNYFNNEIILFATIWLLVKINQAKEVTEEQITQ